MCRETDTSSTLHLGERADAVARCLPDGDWQLDLPIALAEQVLLAGGFEPGDEDGETWTSGGGTVMGTREALPVALKTLAESFA